MANEKLQFSNSYGEYFEIEGIEASCGMAYAPLTRQFLLVRWLDEHGQVKAQYSNTSSMQMPDWTLDCAVV